MFNIPNHPPAQASICELADFAELMSWHKGSISVQEMIRYLGRPADSHDGEENTDDDDENDERLEAVMSEIDRRRTACNAGYPFSRDEDATTVVQYSDRVRQCYPGEVAIYQYLLLATRLNMKTSVRHANINGTDILECVSAHALRRYLGWDQSQSYVFGTSNTKLGFRQKIDELCKRTGEGGKFRNRDGRPTDARDGKLDVVAWIPFPDRMKGKLVVFAQCKTGTHWRDSLTELQPAGFCKKWFLDQPTVEPVRAFCIAEAVESDRWVSYSYDSGLFFDRCRLVHLSSNVDKSLLSKIRKWVNAAFREFTASAK